MPKINHSIFVASSVFFLFLLLWLFWSSAVLKSIFSQTAILNRFDWPDFSFIFDSVTKQNFVCWILFQYFSNQNGGRSSSRKCVKRAEEKLSSLLVNFWLRFYLLNIWYVEQELENVWSEISIFYFDSEQFTQSVEISQLSLFVIKEEKSYNKNNIIHIKPTDTRGMRTEQSAAHLFHFQYS